MQVFLPNTNEDNDAGESLHQLLDSCRSKLFPRGVGIAFPAGTPVFRSSSVFSRPGAPGGDEEEEDDHNRPCRLNDATSSSSSSSGISSAPSSALGSPIVSLERVYRVQLQQDWENDSALYNLKSPFWEEARARIEHTEQDTMRPLLRLLARELDESEKEEEEGRTSSVVDEDTFVSSLLVFPAAATATSDSDSDDAANATRSPKEKRKMDDSCCHNAELPELLSLELDHVFSQEELQVFEQEEAEPMGSPRKKRRADSSNTDDDSYGAMGEDNELGELQSYEEQLYVQLFEM